MSRSFNTQAKALIYSHYPSSKHILKKLAKSMGFHNSKVSQWPLWHWRNSSSAVAVAARDLGLGRNFEEWDPTGWNFLKSSKKKTPNPWEIWWKISLFQNPFCGILRFLTWHRSKARLEAHIFLFTQDWSNDDSWPTLCFVVLVVPTRGP